MNIIVFAICLATIIKCTSYLYKYYVAHKAHAKRIADEAKIADEETLRKAKWQAIDPHLDELDQKQIAEAIRSHLTEKAPS